MSVLHVCFAPADRAWVLGRFLAGLGLAADEIRTREDDQLGALQLDELRRAIETSRYTVLVASRAASFDRLAQHAAALAEYAGLEGNAPRLLVVTRDFAPGSPEEADRLPLGLRALVKLDCSDDDATAASIARLRTSLGRTGSAAAALGAPPCPYPGLRSFDARNHELFFGRTADQDELRARIDGGAPRILVVGPSGSGKSSLVHAGVVPRLIPGRVLVRVVPRGSGNLRAAIRAGVDALEVPGLGPALDGFAADATGASDTDRTAARKRLRALEPPDERRRVVVIDPLEEVFVDTDPAERERVFALLAGLWDQPWCTVVMCMRADFYEQAMELRCWPQLSSARFEMAPLDERGLRDAIVRPAERAGAYLDDALVERLVRDVDLDRASLPLPLLQVTLTRLWDRMSARHIALASYQRLAFGAQHGLAAALAIQADTVVDRLVEPGDDLVAQRVLLDLVHLGDGRITRRRRTLGELRRTGDAPGQLERVLGELVRGRLLVTGERDAPHYDLVHEALIRGWPRFAGWIAERRDALVTQRRIENWAAEFSADGAGHGLLDEGDTAAARAWMASPAARTLGVTHALQQLVEESEAAHLRRRTEREQMIARLEDEQRKTTDSIAAATKLATEIVFEIDQQLRNLAGAHPIRVTLLGRSRELLENLRALAPPSVGELRIAMVIKLIHGDMLLERGQPDAARTLFLEALADARTRAQLAPSDPNRQRDLALLYRRLGDVEVGSGRLDAARTWCEQNVTVMKTLVDAAPTNSTWVQDLAIAYERSGDLALSTGQLEDAEQCHERARALRQQLVLDEPDDLPRQRELAVSHAKLGDTAQLRGRLAQSAEHHQRALDIRQRLAASDRANAIWQRDAYTSHVRLSNVALAARDQPRAAQHAHDALAIIEVLAQTDPTNASWQRDLAVAYEQDGRVALAGRQLERAHRQVQHSLAIMERLVAQDATNLDWQRGVFVACMVLADIAMASSDLDGAWLQLEHAVPAIEQMVRAAPGHVAWQRYRFQAYSRLGNLCARRHDLERSSSWLRRALEVPVELAATHPLYAEWQRERIGMHLDLARLAAADAAQAHRVEAAGLWRRLREAGAVPDDAVFQAMGSELSALGLI